MFSTEYNGTKHDETNSDETECNNTEYKSTENNETESSETEIESNITNISNINSDMVNLKNDCKYLKKYAYFKIVDLPKNAHYKFNRTKKLAESLQGTSQYTQFYQITSKIFGQIITKNRGTVADFFCGCSNVDPATGFNIGCRAECVNSLPLPEDFDNCKCDTHVATYSSWEGLSLIHSPNYKCNMVKIYHTLKNIALSKSEIDLLKNKGVNQAMLIRTQNTTIIRTQNVNNISNLINQNTTTTKKKKNWNGIFFLFIFLIVIIVIIFYLLHKCNESHNYKWDPLPSVHCFFC
jgi:hypothetical protein